MRGAAKAEARSVLVVALAVAVCLLALVATSPAEAAGRYKTVTKTFSNLGGYRPPTPASPTGLAQPRRIPRRSPSQASGRAASST